MRIVIDHQTTYRYANPARYALYALHASPRDMGSQLVMEWSVAAPHGSTLRRSDDSYGNIVDMLCIDHLHSELSFHIHGEVETRDTNGVVSGLAEHFMPRFYLRETALTASTPGIAALAGQARARANGRPMDLVHELVTSVRSAVEFIPGGNAPAGPAGAVLSSGAGGVPDLTHLFIAGARMLGLPARYVAGYHYEGGDSGSGRCHAWAEVHVGHMGWLGIDLVSGTGPGESHVRIASGLDYGEVAPAKGARQGGAEATLDVRLKIEAGQTQQ
ncbi:MAG: transglutaminase family protein [Parvibaculaceae bacterium]|nr:transglutaminase family protein [Parvibaculaceae bacterium]